LRIDVLNEEMIAVVIRVFVGGLRAGQVAPVSLTLIQRRQRSAMRTVQIAAIAVRTETKSRFMSIRFSAVRQYCSYSKTPTEENGHALHQHFYVHSN
jgi:hypothetical protein